MSDEYTKLRNEASCESRADAGITMGTDNGYAYESGFQSGADWARSRLDKVRELPAIQYQSTTSMDEYNTGMYNGLECAIACFDEREANYKDVEKSDLQQKLAIAREALEHYECSHYCNEGYPCTHDNTAKQALEEIKC